MNNAKTKRVAVVDCLAELLPYTQLRQAVEDHEGSFEVLACRTPTEVVERCADSEILVLHWVKLDRQVLSSLAGTQAIVRYGIGYDMIDVDAATDNGIIVCNTPGFCTDEVADHTMMLLLAVVRKLNQLQAHAQAGVWELSEGSRVDRTTIHRLRGRILGLVGFGRIARAVAKRALGFGATILAHDPHIDFQVAGMEGVRGVSLDHLLSESDFVSIHVPLTEETRGLLGRRQIREMRASSILINWSRGPIVDETAMIDALRQGFIAGAGLDVLAEEPPDSGNPLPHMENVVLTPHYASASAESGVDQSREIIESVVAILDGRWPPHAVNRRVTPKKPLTRGGR